LTFGDKAITSKPVNNQTNPLIDTPVVEEDRNIIVFKRDKLL
jgi:hypothetical protein